jgi:hypothetical protein
MNQTQRDNLIGKTLSWIWVSVMVILFIYIPNAQSKDELICLVATLFAGIVSFTAAGAWRHLFIKE